MMPASTASRLAHLIDAEQGLLRRFLTLLEREEALLVAGETDALMALSREKTEIYHLLQRQHDTRAQLLRAEKLPNTDAAIRQVCAGAPDTLARWDANLELARTAQARNQSNGKLITERMHNNQAALSVLLTAAEAPQLYDAAGAARPTGRGRHLGSA